MGLYENPAPRGPTRHRVAIIGSGFSGLGMAIRLKQSGMSDFVVFEKAGGVGGTWRVNHYPGCACDVQSHLYSYSFEPNPRWSRMFAPQPEIKTYLEGCAEKDGVMPLLRFNTEIRSARWNEETALWHITDAEGVAREVDAIIFGTGFKATDPVPKGVVHDRDGQDLVDAWPQGPEAYKGAAIAGFPNLFFIMGPNTGLSHNSMIYMIESQIAYVADALKTMDRRRLRSVEVRAAAQQRFNESLHARLRKAIWRVGGCMSWYVHPVSARNVTLWPGFTWQFRLQTRRFDALAYTLKPAGAPRSLGSQKPVIRKQAMSALLAASTTSRW